MDDDIVTRLQEQLDGPIPMVIERQDVRDAIDEIEILNKTIDVIVAKVPIIIRERDRWRNVASYFETAIVNEFLEGGVPPGSIWLQEALEDYRKALRNSSDITFSESKDHMIKDIVEELRYAIEADKCPWDVTLYERAAIEIEELRDRVKKLSVFLHPAGTLIFDDRNNLK